MPADRQLWQVKFWNAAHGDMTAQSKIKQARPFPGTNKAVQNQFMWGAGICFVSTGTVRSNLGKNNRAGGP
jgi:hypothetical protein